MPVTSILNKFIDVSSEVRVARASLLSIYKHPSEGDIAFRKRMAIHSLEAILFGFTAAGLKVQRRNRALVRFLTRKFHSLFMDPKGTINSCKSSYTRIRSDVISRSETPRDILGIVVPRCWYNITDNRFMQLCMTSRALPRPDAATIKAAVVKAHETFTTPAPKRMSDQLKESLLKHLLPLKQGIKKDRDLSDRKKRHIVSVGGTSASLFTTRSQGGRSALLRGLRMDLANKRSGYNPLSKPGSFVKYKAMPLDTFRPAAQSRTFFRALSRQYPDDRGTAVTEVVPELGFKARVVTKSHPVTVAAGHELRRICYPFLRKWRQTRTALGDRPTDLKFHYWKSGPGSFYSADLTKATDGLSHEVMDFVCDILDIDSQLIHKDMTVDGLPTCRGAFMGLPMSWTILSIVHLSAAKVADPSGNFYIKGDDLVAFWTRHQWNKYLSVMEETGMPLNLTKTFIGRTALFCEGFYRPRWQNKHVRLRLVPQLSLRKYFPERECSLSSLAECTSSLPEGLAARHNLLVKRQYRNILWMCRDRKVNPYLPNSLGGAGILIPKRDHKVLSAADRCHLNAVFGGVAVPPKVKELWAHFVEPNARSEMSYLAQLSQMVRYVPEKSGPTCSCFETHLARCAAAAAFHDDWKGVHRKVLRNSSFLKTLKRLDRTMGIDYPVTYGEAFALAATLRPLRTKLGPFKGCKCA